MKNCVYQLFQSLIDLMESPMPARETVSCYLMLSILSITAELSKNMLGHQGTDTASSRSALCLQIKEYILANYNRELTLEIISNALSISPWYMSRVFKKETGYSPMQYVTNLRLGEAQVLLIHTSMPVTVVAQSVGYSSSGAFNYSFRKMFGITPTEFRRLYKI